MAYTCVRVTFEIGHEAVVRNKKTPQGFTHDWELYVRGADNTEIQHFVDKVIFHLHESFHNPKRVIKEAPYVVRESGYAGFSLLIDIYLKNKHEPYKISFNYQLTLQEIGGPPLSNCVREKYVFRNPSEDFRRKLIKGGGVGVGAESTSGHHMASLNSADEHKNSVNKIKSFPQDVLAAKKSKKESIPKDEEQLSANDPFSIFGQPIKTSKIPFVSKSSSKSISDSKANQGQLEKQAHSSKPSKHNSSSHKDKDREKEKERDKEKEKEKVKDKDKEKDKSSSKKNKDESSKKEKSVKEEQKVKTKPSKEESKKPSYQQLEEKPKEKPLEKTEKELKLEKKEKEKKHKEEKKSKLKEKHKNSEKREIADSKENVDRNEKLSTIHAGGVTAVSATFKEDSKEEKKHKAAEEREDKSEKVKEKLAEPKSLFSNGNVNNVNNQSIVNNVDSSKKEEKHKHHKHKKDKSKKDSKRDKEERKEKRESKENKEKHVSPMVTATAPPIEMPKLTPKSESPKRLKRPLKTLFEELSDKSDSEMSSLDEEPNGKLPPKEPDSPDMPSLPIKEEEMKQEEQIKVESKRKNKKSNEEKESRRRKRKSKDKDESPLRKLSKYEREQMMENSVPELPEPASDSRTKSMSPTSETKFTDEYVMKLKELQRKIMTLEDNLGLQRIVQVVAETGQYEITTKTFDFDLCTLDKSIVQRLSDFFVP